MPRKSSRRRAPLNRKALAAALLAGLPACLWLATAALGGYHDFQAGNYLEAWSFRSYEQQLKDSEFSPAAEDIDRALAHARSAVRLSPYKAEYQEHLGSILLWLHHTPPEVQAQQPEWRDQSMQSFREAIRLRPAWPDTYLRLARAKALLNRPDAEMQAALRQSMQLAPWKPAAMNEVLDIGLYTWDRLSADSQRLVADTFIRSQQWRVHPKTAANAAQDAFNLIVLHKKAHEICAMVPWDIPDVAAFCQASTT